MLLPRPRVGLLCAAATTLRSRSPTTGAASLCRRKFERDEGIGRCHVPRGGTTAASGDNDVLCAVFAHVCDGRRVSIGGKLGDPEFSTRLRVKRAESLIDRRADEDETAGRCDASTNVADAALQPDLTEFR